MQIIKKNEYGSIKLNLRYLMDKKNISINTMSKYANIRYETVKKYYNNECFWYDSNILAKFCYVLECEIDDLLVYEDTKMLQKV